jgi:hypothetical protein
MEMTRAMHWWRHPMMVLGLADRDGSVTAGREALDRWIRDYPWYDPKTDGVRPIEVSEPWYLKWKWLLDRLEDVFTFRGGGIGSAGWVQWLAWLLIAVTLIVLVYLMVRVFLMRERGKSKSAAGREPSDAAEEKRRVEALPPAAARRPSDLLGEARRCYERGDYGQAVVYLFSHQLVRLDKSQLIRLARGKTNRQYLRELGRRMPLRRLLEQTMVAFEDVFFGNYAINRARFESVWSRLGEFEALVAEGAA